MAGLKGQPVCFIFTDAEVKDEAFLEYINQLLMTGEAWATVGLALWGSGLGCLLFRKQREVVVPAASDAAIFFQGMPPALQTGAAA